MPSREEIIAYIKAVAAAKGIDPATFLAVVNGESGFDPAAKGDYKDGVPQSFGLGQFFSGGEGPGFTEATGFQASDPTSWKAQIDYMADRVLKKGWTPWHAAANQGIGARQGLPGGTQGQVAGRRGRTGEVAQLSTTQPQQGEPSLLDELRKMIEEKSKESTLGEQAVLAVDRAFGGNSTKTQTLGSAVLKPLLGKSPEEQDIADTALKGKGGAVYNPTMAMSRDAQVAALQPRTVADSIMGMFAPPGTTAPGLPKKKTLGPTLWNTLFG